MEEDAVLCIFAMDAKLLNDIGMDVDKFAELSAKLPPAK
jgi:hypothetical protein